MSQRKHEIQRKVTIQKWSENVGHLQTSLTSKCHTYGNFTKRSKSSYSASKLKKPFPTEIQLVQHKVQTHFLIPKISEIRLYLKNVYFPVAFRGKFAIFGGKKIHSYSGNFAAHALLERLDSFKWDIDLKKTFAFNRCFFLQTEVWVEKKNVTALAASLIYIILCDLWKIFHAFSQYGQSKFHEVTNSLH